MRRFWTTLAMGFAILSPAFAMAGDQEIAQQIGQNLKNSGKLKGYSINVKVQEGVAQLNGTVSSAQQLDDALSIAEVTPGIERVVNNLSVKAPTAKPAATAASALRQPTNLFAQEQQADIQQTVAASPASMPAQMPLQQYQQMTSAPRGNQPLGAPIPGRGMPPQMMAARQAGAPAMLPQGPVQQAGGYPGGPMPAAIPSPNMMPAPMAYDAPSMPNYAWPSYAAHPNYAAVTYPKQYSASAWPYIGPFYPYPQVPMGWRKVSLEWDDGWWMLDFKDSH